MMILKRMKGRISNNDIRKLAVGIFFSKIQYRIIVYGTVKLKLKDHLLKNTQVLQVMANKEMRFIKPGKSSIREWGTEKPLNKIELEI